MRRRQPITHTHADRDIRIGQWPGRPRFGQRGVCGGDGWVAWSRPGRAGRARSAPDAARTGSDAGGRRPAEPRDPAAARSGARPGDGGGSGVARPRRWRRTRSAGRAIRRRVRALPGGRTLFRVIVAVLGLLVVALGLALVPLPGPGWAIVFGGLAIWAIEFAWAAQLLNWVRRQVRAFARRMSRLHWTLRTALGLASWRRWCHCGWLWIKHRYGFETMTQFWQYITTH